MSLKKAVENQSEKHLIAFLEFIDAESINPDQYELIEKALIGTWHSQHEDLVSTIHMGNLKGDRFVEPLLNIALNEEVYRWYDDELEATLRKCVHALKTINSEKSIDALNKLKSLNNENVFYALEVYN